MDSAQPKKRRKYFSQRGVALLAVSVATSIAGVFVVEFSTNTNVDMAAARNAADDMRLHFLTRSGMNLSQLIIRVQSEILDRNDVRQVMGDLQLADYTGLFMGAFGGSQEELEGVAEMLGGFAARDMKGLGVPEGRFDVQITTEDNKINLNCANGSATDKANLYTQLVNLFFPRGYDELFQNADAEGWRRDRETQAKAFIDYVDRDRIRFDLESPNRGPPEDYGYETLQDKYKAKDNYLDTVGEIKLIRGVDDRFWTLFGDAFTVYGDCKINLNATDDPLLIANIIFVSTKDADRQDPGRFNENNIIALAQLVIAARGFGYSFAAQNAREALKLFADFIKDPQGTLAGLTGQQDLSGAQNLPIDPQLLALLQQVQGLELDTNLLGNVATAGPRRTYKVEAFASLGEDGNPNQMSKRIIGVWDKQPTPQNTRSNGNEDVTGRAGFGAWIYWRED